MFLTMVIGGVTESVHFKSLFTITAQKVPLFTEERVANLL